MDVSLGNITTTYSDDNTVIISSYPFSITCFVGSLEDFALYYYYFDVKESINFPISKNISSHSIEIFFDVFSDAFNGKYSCGAGNSIHPNITLMLYYIGSGLLNNI